MIRGRTNQASALTRAARKALANRVFSVNVKSYDYIGGGEVSGQELEPLMAARQILTEAGLECSDIKTQYKNLPKCFYIQFPTKATA